MTDRNMTDKKVIGLCGYSGSGKDAIGKILVEERGFTRVAFADPLRKCLLKLNPIINSVEFHYVRLFDLINHRGWGGAKTYFEVRRLLQVLGTEVGRDILGENIWVNIAKQKINECKQVVVTDVRFENEEALIHDHYQGIILKVHRPGIGPVNDHCSEHQEIKFNDIIYNDGDLNQLKTKILGLVDTWLAS